MAINFPNNPTTNQTFTVGVKTWIWNGYAWDIQTANTTPITSLAQAAFDQANTASANTVYTQGVDTEQNTRLLSVEANTGYLFGGLNQTNTNIVNANTQLKSYVDGQISYVNDINNTQNTNITTNNNLAQGAYDTANLKFNTSGGNITGPVTISSNLTITGNLTVAGNVTTVSANNLILKDNMIYLNDGSVVANPDLGIAGNYNDGIYRHAGFFRDASDGVWKVYDQYLPEPDASPYIDTSNSSFRIADFQANNVTFGKITTSSSQLVSNLNADYLDGQHGSYYAVDSVQSGINNTQNTNITGATTLAQAAYNQANTDYTTVAPTAGTYGGTTNIPVVTVTANGRVSAISNTSITAGATITDDTSSNANRYVMLGQETSGTYTVANTSSTKLYFNPSTGTLSSTIFNSLSDENQKDNIVKIDNAVYTINQINGYEFNWKDNGEKSSGVIAQQLEPILPHLVTESEGTKSVNYSGLIGYLIEGMKDQQKQIDELKSIINSNK